MRKLIGVAVVVLLAACGGGKQQQMPPPDVNVAAVVKKSVTEWDEYSGHIEAIESAEIRPRVAGHLDQRALQGRRHGREGPAALHDRQPRVQGDCRCGGAPTRAAPRRASRSRSRS